jgi:hypothetical protein
MSTKSDYPDEEWAALLRAPIVAGTAIPKSVTSTHKGLSTRATRLTT